MKHTFGLSLTVLILTIAGCNNGVQNDAEKQAALIQKTMKESKPGSIATSSGGYYMTAKMDGKEWSASHMMPDDDERSSYKMIRGENGSDYITFQLWKRGVELGKKVSFTEDHAANLSLDDDFLGGRSGEIEITKINDQWLEGTFKFTATTGSSNRKVEVTDGRFRVASGLNNF